jgi:hypothetical protein
MCDRCWCAGKSAAAVEAYRALKKSLTPPETPPATAERPRQGEFSFGEPLDTPPAAPAASGPFQRYAEAARGANWAEAVSTGRRPRRKATK